MADEPTLALNKSRAEMLAQRNRSIPLRWFTLVTLDPKYVAASDRGYWNDVVPTCPTN